MAFVFWLIGLALVILVKASDDTCCPDSWLPYKGSCYLFHDEEKMDWNEAQQYCKNKVKNKDDVVTLVAIETRNENLFLQYFARKLYNVDSKHRNNTVFWLGASDGNIEGIWKWVDKDEELTFTDWDIRYHSKHRNNTVFWLGASDGDIEGIWKWVDKDEELTFTDWDISLSQPNKNPDNHEDCLALNGAYDFNWHDGFCRERIGYPLCEKKGAGDSVGMAIIG